MDNTMQTEVCELELDELRKVTWDYAKNELIGYFRDVVFRSYLFEVVDSGDIHPLTVQRCNVAEGWIEHVVCESYPEVEDTTKFFIKAIVKRDENGEIIRKRVYCDVAVKLLGVKGNTLFTLSKEK